MQKNEKKTEALRQAMPGRDVDVLDGKVKVRVVPLRYGKLRAYAERMSDLGPAMQAMMSVLDGEDNDDASMIKALAGTLAPFLLGPLSDLLDDSIDVPLNDLPHDAVAVILSAWLEETFGGGKLQAWTKAVETLGLLGREGVNSTSSTQPPS